MIRKSCLKLIKKNTNRRHWLHSPFFYALQNVRHCFVFLISQFAFFFLLNLDLKRSFRRWKDSCGQQYTCNLLWKGFGRWTNSAWVPYIDGESWITIKNLNKFANSELPSNKGSNTDIWEIYKIRSKLKQNTPFSTRKKYPLASLITTSQSLCTCSKSIETQASVQS